MPTDKEQPKKKARESVEPPIPRGWMFTVTLRPEERRKQRELGRKMTAGRKPGTVGPIRLAIRTVLAKTPAIKNDPLWEVLKAKPPQGWTFYENKLGRYIEGPKPTDGMGWRSFCNAASDERKLRR